MPPLQHHAVLLQYLQDCVRGQRGLARALACLRPLLSVKALWLEMKVVRLMMLDILYSSQIRLLQPFWAIRPILGAPMQNLSQSCLARSTYLRAGSSLLRRRLLSRSSCTLMRTSSPATLQ